MDAITRNEDRCCGPPRRTVMLVPGVGGHPVFHDELIRGLRERYLVRSAPHVDFSSAPCADWERHVQHWEQQLVQARKGAADSPAIVGISFGAHVANALREALPRGSLHRVVLLSYRHLTRVERSVLRALPRFPRMAPALVGTTLFRLSELQTTDRERLRAQRRELYDDERAVRARLAARLTALSSAPELPDGPVDATTFILGERERTLLRRHRRHGHHAALVPGGHNVSLRESSELLDAIDHAIGTGRGQERGSDR